MTRPGGWFWNDGRVKKSGDGMTVETGEWILDVRVGLVHSVPEIWRRLELPAALTLGQVHQVLQVRSHVVMKTRALRPPYLWTAWVKCLIRTGLCYFQNMSELVPVESSQSADMALLQFEGAMLATVEAHGLPSEGVLVSVDERKDVLINLESSLRKLSPEKRNSSLYISKMVAAACAGLFDAALNYVWDETIAELRSRVARYDLKYFFDVAISNPDRRRQFNSAEDLAMVTDVDLLRACHGIGLLSEIAHKRLDSIRFMRNHASAAHPNHNELSGLEIAHSLRICVDNVIVLPLDDVTVAIGELLRRVKETRFTQSQIDGTSSFFNTLSGQQHDSLSSGLFGIFLDLKSSPESLDNVRLLWPALWPHLEDDTRNRFGVKIASFIANGDHETADRVREIFDIPEDAGRYLPAGVRVKEIRDAIDELLNAHRSYNNFYNEPGPARKLESLVGVGGDVPSELESPYVSAIVEAYLGNGYGLCNAAMPIYDSLLGKLDSAQAWIALLTFRDLTISSKLQVPLAQGQWKSLLAILTPKITQRSRRDVLKSVKKFTGTPDKLGHDSEVKRLLAAASTK